VNTLIRFTALPGLCLLAGAVAAAPEVAPAPRSWEVAPTPRTVVRKPLPWTVPETQEVVVFAPTRPVRIKLSVQCEGKPIIEMWQERLRKVYDAYDRDRDGYLNDRNSRSLSWEPSHSAQYEGELPEVHFFPGSIA